MSHVSLESIMFVCRTDIGMHEHVDPHSYSWCLLRYVIVYHVRRQLVAFLPQIGIELPGTNLVLNCPVRTTVVTKQIYNPIRLNDVMMY